MTQDHSTPGRRRFLGSMAGAVGGALAVESRRPPNFIVLLADNLGYGDLGCYGSTRNRTPHIDRMAKEGMRFTDFYSASGVCTPSRASLMTGCYPRRVGLHFTDPDGAVLRPVSQNGLDPSEVTIADILKNRHYYSAIVGKWHLGDQPPFLPTRQGFDYFLGIPYSDDMVGGGIAPWQRTPWPPLPLMENDRVIEAPVDRNLLTRRYTEKCIEILNQRGREPFFIYLAHAVPGSTTSPFASDAFRGKSANGSWGDSVEEIDWSTGEILAALKRLGLDDNTLVVFTSDNGAPQSNPPRGSNRPLSGWGYSTQEGGQRVPCIARWPGRIPAGRVSETLTTMMDFLPTFAALAGGHRPSRVIDGKDIWPVLSGRSKESPHEAFFYYYGPQLQAVRSGKWKLFPASGQRWANLTGRTAPTPAELYDLEKDTGETTNVAAAHPEVVRRLTALAEKARQDLGDVGRTGRGQRPVGRFAHPTPRVLR